MSNGEPAATNFTSISVSERLVDDRGNPKTNEVIQDWLRLHHARVRALQCDAMGIQVSIFLMPHDAYEGLSFTPETARAAADAGCGLRVLTYRVLEKKEDSQQGN